MSTIPRWPEFFPDMKVRGGRRRAGQRQSQKITKHSADMRAVGEAMQAAMNIDWSGVLGGISEAVRKAADALGDIGRQLFEPRATQADYALMPVPLFELKPEDYKIVTPRRLPHTGIDLPATPIEYRIGQLLDNLRPADSAPVPLWDERDELDDEWDEVDPWDARPDTGCATCDGGGCGDCA